MSEISEILVAPIESVVTEIAKCVGLAQIELDRATLAMASEVAADSQLSQLGYVPTSYVIPEVVVELKMVLHFESTNKKPKGGIFGAMFNAKYQNESSFKGEGTSSIKLRIVPVPRAGGVDNG